MKKWMFVLSFLLATLANAGNAAGNAGDSLVVLVPNVFTPNGDGINDTWSIIIKAHGVTVFSMQTTVYDRWGKQVFQTTNIHEVWSGHNSIGEFCSSGSYYYVITYTNGATGKNEAFKGFIELIR